LKDWTYNVTHHTFIHESIKKFRTAFTTMLTNGMLISTIAALSTFYHDAKDISARNHAESKPTGSLEDADDSAFSYRHSLGCRLSIRTTS